MLVVASVASLLVPLHLLQRDSHVSGGWLHCCVLKKAFCSVAINLPRGRSILAYIPMQAPRSRCMHSPSVQGTRSRTETTCKRQGIFADSWMGLGRRHSVFEGSIWIQCQGFRAGGGSPDTGGTLPSLHYTRQHSQRDYRSRPDSFEL